MYMHLEVDNIHMHTAIEYFCDHKKFIRIKVNDTMELFLEVKGISYLCIISDLGVYLRIKDGEWCDFNKN